MYQFFVEPEQIRGNKIIITGKDVNHIKNVLRMKVEEEISISNGMDGKEYRCGIKEFNGEEIVCEVRFIKEDGVELPSKIYLFQGLPKADKMEWIIQKAVELGVYEVIPVAVNRSVVKLDERKAQSKILRWKKVAEAADKKRKRGIIPGVRNVMSFREAIDYSRCADIKIIPYELAEGMEKTREVFDSLRPGKNVAVFIGPEGGFSTEEIEDAIKAGMGRRILRTETAGMTVLSIIMYHLEQ